MRSTAKIEMVGRRFASLLVVAELPERNKNGHILYLCKCDCGRDKEILGASIRQGRTTSCGCNHKLAITKHGADGSKTYRAWIGMKTRCTNQNMPRFEGWGGRGITICDRWMDFENFLSDMGEAPEGTSLDRIDNSKGYSPDNCRWATAKEQAQNRRSTILIKCGDEIVTVEVFAKSVGLTVSGARKRIHRTYKQIDGIFIKEGD